MERHYNPLRDLQQAAPIAHCPRCRKSEIYACDEVADIGGALAHQDCMTAEELEDYPTHPAVSFYQEAC